MERHRMDGGVSLGHIAGIELRFDWSLLIIVWLLAAGLALGILPAWHPAWGPGLRRFAALLATALFVASIVVHELAHAMVGRRYGIKVRRITLFVFGGVAHMECSWFSARDCQGWERAWCRMCGSC